MKSLTVRAPFLVGTVIATALLSLASGILSAATLVWDFEGRVEVEGDPIQDRLYDQTGTLKFHLISPGDQAPGNGNTFDRFAEGTPSNPVRYDAINDESPITNTPGANPLNEWLVRADWGYNGVSHIKHGDSDLGEFISDVFVIDETSSFTMDVGGGSAPNGFYLHRAEDDSVILTESRGGGFVQQRDWTNAELTGAGVIGSTEVYLRIADETTGGWGNVSVDNIVATNSDFVSAAPRIKFFRSNPPGISAAGEVTLEWEVDNATALAIDRGVGDVTGLTSMQVTVSETSVYTLTASNAEGDSTAMVSVGVNQVPLIHRFEASQASVNEGGSVILSWDAELWDLLEIDNGVGEVTGLRQITVNPFTTTTYTLLGSNEIGEATAEVVVTVISPGLVWNFEGRVPVEGDPFQDRLYDRDGNLKFHLVTPGVEPPGDGNTFDRFGEGIPSNPVRYDAINDEQSITDTLGADPTNEWLIRADWSFNGVSHTKHADGDTGEFISDAFTIDETSFFTMDVGGGSAPNGLYLHRVEDDSVVISEHRGGQFLQKRDWTNAELTGAGVSGPTDVYLRIADATTGGWGNVSVDNIAGFNVEVTGADAPFHITSITHNTSPASLTIRWESEDGFLYNLRSETDLSPEPATWPIHGGNQDLSATPPENSLTIALPEDLTRFFVVERFPAPPASVFSENFDAAAALPAGWTTGASPPDTGSTLWQVGPPTGTGPAAANSPPNCAATNLGADYGEESDIYLRTPAIDLTTAGGATLNYAQFKDIESGFDFGSVAVLDAADDSQLAVLEAVVDGSADWTQISKTIPAAALGKSVKLEFRFQSDDIMGFAGWYLDNVEVTVP